MTPRDEAAVSAIGGAFLGGIAGHLVGAGGLGAVIGATNGAVTGWRRIYDWRSPRGRLAFILDSTWSMATTASGLVLLGVSKVRQTVTGQAVGFEPSLSVRKSRMVHRGGVVPRRGFAVTIGNVVNGAADRHGELPASRCRLVDEHEDVHVWQARILGPLYPILYLGWFIGGVLVATIRGRRVPNRSLVEEIDRLAYYMNPFEWHAYSRGGNWPPAAVDSDRVWKRPFRSFPGTREVLR